jgi:hypothetical protein
MDEKIVFHITPAIDESCDHDWAYAKDDDGQENPTHCTKCGLSFTRYIFCCMP